MGTGTNRVQMRVVSPHLVGYGPYLQVAVGVALLNVTRVQRVILFVKAWPRDANVKVEIVFDDAFLLPVRAKARSRQACGNAR